MAFDQVGEPKFGILDPRSSELVRFGRIGDGPGEVIGNPPFSWFGDTLVIAGRHMSVYLANGDLARTAPIATHTIFPPVGDSASHFLGVGRKLGPLPGKRFLSELLRIPGDPLPDAVGAGPLRAAFAIVRLDGVIETILHWMPSLDQSSCRGQFCPRHLAAMDANGEMIVIVEPVDGIPDSATAAIHVYDHTGTEHATWRVQARAVEVPPSVLDSIREAERARGSQVDVIGAPDGVGGAAGTASSSSRDAAVAISYPLVRRVRVGNDRTIWLYHPANRHWCAWSAEGRAAGCLVLEPGEELVAATSDSVWVLAKDQDDVPSVVLYAIY